MDTQGEIAVVVGVGPGLGASLARAFRAAGMAVALAARDIDKLEGLLAELGPTAHAFDCDATDEAQVAALFKRIKTEMGEPNLVVYNAGRLLRREIGAITAQDMEAVWRTNCLGGFLVGQAAAAGMRARAATGGKGGTVIFTGATASLRGGKGFAAFASAKFGLRAVAQSMARELGPEGVHVAHVVIDGIIGKPIGDAPRLDPAAIAETYLAIHRQPKSCWTLEVDLRPASESF